jgi:hypothetical protein
MAEKIDLKKQFKHLYSLSKAGRIEIVDVPPLNFLMVEGKGDPNTSQEYANAIQALYSLSYTMKFTIKLKEGIDFTVMGLEGLWWAEDMGDFINAKKDTWQWNAMIMQPDFITPERVEQARKEVVKKKEVPGIEKARLEKFHESLSAQVLYLGPYANEGPTIAGLHAFIVEQGYVLSGKHHEIYLSDPRRVPPERLKTVIRQPMRKA